MKGEGDPALTLVKVSLTRRGKSVELQDYWRTVRRRWRLVLGSVLVVLAVAAAWTWSVTPTYASTTRIFVSTSQTDENSAYTGNLFATQRVASYADLVTSNQLAERVADELGDTDAMDLREQVTASAVPETVLLEIEAQDADAERARDIAQAYAEQLQIVVEELETPRGESAAVVKATLIDDAQVARSPVSPQPLRNLALAGILGLLLGVGLAVGLAFISVEFEREQRVRLHRELIQISAVIFTQLEGDLLDRAEHVVRAGVGGVGRAEGEAAAESKAQRRVEVRLVPELAAWPIGPARALVQAVPRPEVDADRLQTAVGRREGDAEVEVRPHDQAFLFLPDAAEHVGAGEVRRAGDGQRAGIGVIGTRLGSCHGRQAQNQDRG